MTLVLLFNQDTGGAVVVPTDGSVGGSSTFTGRTHGQATRHDPIERTRPTAPDHEAERRARAAQRKAEARAREAEEARLEEQRLKADLDRRRVDLLDRMDSAALTAAERQLSEARAIRLQLENRAKQALAAWQKIAIESASRTQADLDRMAAQIAAARQEAEARTLEARRIEEEESFAVILIAIASQDKLLH